MRGAAVGLERKRPGACWNIGIFLSHVWTAMMTGQRLKEQPSEIEESQIDRAYHSALSLLGSEHLLDMLAAILVCCFQIKQTLTQFVHLSLQSLCLALKLFAKWIHRERDEPIKRRQNGHALETKLGSRRCGVDVKKARGMDDWALIGEALTSYRHPRRRQRLEEDWPFRSVWAWRDVALAVSKSFASWPGQSAAGQPAPGFRSLGPAICWVSVGPRPSKMLFPEGEREKLGSKRGHTFCSASFGMDIVLRCWLSKEMGRCKVTR